MKQKGKKDQSNRISAKHKISLILDLNQWKQHIEFSFPKPNIARKARDETIQFIFLINHSIIRYCTQITKTNYKNKKNISWYHSADGQQLISNTI